MAEDNGWMRIVRAILHGAQEPSLLSGLDVVNVMVND